MIHKKKDLILSLLLVIGYLFLPLLSGVSYPEDIDSPILKPIYSDSNLKGAFGEALVEEFYKQEGWESILSREKPQGIDKVFYKPGVTKPYKPLVVEVKTGKNALSLPDTKTGKEMSNTWIRERISDISDKRTRGFLEKGYFRKRLVHIIPESDGSFNIAVYKIEEVNKIPKLIPYTKETLKVPDKYLVCRKNNCYVHVPAKIPKDTPEIIKRLAASRDKAILKIISDKRYIEKLEEFLVKKRHYSKRVASIIVRKFVDKVKKDPSKFNASQYRLLNEMSLQSAIMKGLSVSLFMNIDYVIDAFRGERDPLEVSKRVATDTLGYGATLKVVNGLFVRVGEKYGILAWLPEDRYGAQTALALIAWDGTRLATSYFKGDISYDEALSLVRERAKKEAINISSYVIGDVISSILVTYLPFSSAPVVVGPVTLGVTASSLGTVTIAFVAAMGVRYVIKKGIEIHNEEVSKNYLFFSDLLGVLPEEFRNRITPWELPEHENPWALPEHENPWTIPEHESPWD